MPYFWNSDAFSLFIDNLSIYYVILDAITLLAVISTIYVSRLSTIPQKRGMKKCNRSDGNFERPNMSNIKAKRQKGLFTPKLSKHELEEEKMMEKLQLEKIFELLRQQEDKFNVKSMKEVHDQLAMYSIKYQQWKKKSNIISEAKDKDKSNMDEIQNVPAETKIQDNEENIKTKSEDSSEPDKENKLIEAVVTPLLAEPEEETTFRVIYNKNKYDVSFPLNMTVMQLKSHLQNIIGVPQAMQKVMIKGLAKDEKTLKELGVSKASKIMVVGSKLDDVLAVSTPGVVESASDSSSSSTKEPFCKQKMHRRVLDKGIPEDVMPGIRNLKESLPQHPLTGMLNKAGGKVRLTFKLELDQLWIGSKERTEKIPMASIKLVVSEPIENHEEYHILALQLGPTEASRYWVYWVPAQYVDAIKDAILGAWSM